MDFPEKLRENKFTVEGRGLPLTEGLLMGDPHSKPENSLLFTYEFVGKICRLTNLYIFGYLNNKICLSDIQTRRF